ESRGERQRSRDRRRGPLTRRAALRALWQRGEAGGEWPRALARDRDRTAASRAARPREQRAGTQGRGGAARIAGLFVGTAREATATRSADARERVGRGSGALASGLTGALAGGLTGVAVLDELRARIACELLGVGLLVTDLERGMLHRCGRRRCRRIGGGGETRADDCDGG